MENKEKIMKQRLIVTLLLLATLLSAASGVGIYANGIEEDSVAGVEGISSVDLPLGTPYETALNSLPKTATLNIWKWQRVTVRIY